MIVDSTAGRKLSKYRFQDIFNALFKTCGRLELPVAVWKLPNEKEWQIVIGETVSVIQQQDVESLEPGFILNKFENKGFEKSFYFKSKLHFIDYNLDFNLIRQTLSGDFLEIFEEELNSAEKNILSYNYSFQNANEDPVRFKLRVENALNAINKGDFQKVILSRRKEILFDQPIEMIRLFEKLSNLYTTAFTSLISIPGMGVWIGASPETLISIKDNIFKTCALAGTQQMKENVRLKDVLWSQKEIEEQAFVSRYIINSFKSIRLREFEEEGPKTVPAGNLLHLRTDLKVNMKEVDFPRLGTQMLELLHPTSAVCGMPHVPAFNFILSHEDFNRELYAGYLGPVNINNSINIFVNLRCMKIEGRRAVLFAGVGITEDSDPQKEWMETEMKFKTLLNVLAS